MIVRRIVRRVGTVAADVVLALVSGVALLVAPTRLGGLLRTITIPRLREHRFRTSLTVMGIALGIAVLIAVALVNRSILGSIAATIDDVTGKADLSVSGGSSGFDAALYDTVTDTPGVYKAAYVVEETTTLRDPKAGSERVLVLGIDFLNADDDYFRTYGSGELHAIHADPILFLNSPYHLILGRSLAQRLGYKLRDQVPLETPDGVHRFEIWGFLDDKGVGRAFGGAVAVMDYGAMQVAFDRGSNVDRIDVAVRPGLDVSSVASALKIRLGRAFTVERPERKNDRIDRMLGSLSSGLAMASVVALLVGMFLIHNTVSISVVQRRREIGIIRALGARRRDVVFLFTFEGILLGVVGSGLGVLLGILLARSLLTEMTRTVSDMFLPIATQNLSVDRWLLVGSAALGVLATTIAAAIPARSAAHALEVETLRGTTSQGTWPGRRGIGKDLLAGTLIAGSAVLLRIPPIRGLPLGALGTCFLLVLSAALWTPRVVWAVHGVARALLEMRGNIATRLATENLPRNIGRTSATAAALTVGVAMATAFAGFVGSFESSTVEWVDQMLPADLWITSASRVAGGGNNAPLSDDLGAPLSVLPDVERIERMRMVGLDYRGFPIKLVATDVAVFGRRSRFLMLEGTQEEAMEETRRGAVVVAENFSRRFNVHRGDHIQLAVKDGTRTFDVCGVMIDYTSDTGLVMMDRAAYVENWGDTRVDAYKLYLRGGADPERTRQSINRAFGERYDLFVLTNREFREEVVAMLDQAFDIMHVLEAVAIIIAVLGVVNALLANVLDRVREIAVLRAIGMLRRQVEAMVVVEGLLVGIVGVLGGILLGIAIGHVLLRYINVVQTGWYLPFRPSWWSVVETAVAVMAGSALAGWYPARHASRLVIVDALEYE